VITKVLFSSKNILKIVETNFTVTAENNFYANIF